MPNGPPRCQRTARIGPAADGAYAAGIAFTIPQHAQWQLRASPRRADPESPDPRSDVFPGRRAARTSR